MTVDMPLSIEQAKEKRSDVLASLAEVFGLPLGVTASDISLTLEDFPNYHPTVPFARRLEDVSTSPGIPLHSHM